jgi:two-component system, cell cycle sensor histidine kinase and response regulator CckA
LLRRTIDKRIEMRCDFGAERDLVMADPGQLQQVVLNLAVNARDAMPEGGRMRFLSREIEIRPEDALRFPELAPGAYLSLYVEDSGSGIPKDLQARIFEPFFTTKGPGKGSGMGLAMVYGILRQHGGSIRVESEPGAGARFGIFLPLAEAGAGAPQAAAAPAVLMHGKGCILVVDDEAVVRATATELLRYLGYVVLHAEGGREALDIYRARGAEIDLVLLDLMMPDLDGRETLVELRALDPKVCVVLSSGFDRQPAQGESFGVRAQALPTGRALAHRRPGPRHGGGRGPAAGGRCRRHLRNARRGSA